MNFTKSGNSEEIKELTGIKKIIKRRNFLGILGISAVGAFLLTKLPAKLFNSNINKAVSRGKSFGKPSIIVKENPYAIKRTGKNVNANTKNNG